MTLMMALENGRDAMTDIVTAREIQHEKKYLAGWIG